MPIVHYENKSSFDALSEKVILTDEQFDKLARKSEAKSKSNYQAYLAKLALFARLGYVYIFSILLILIAAIIGLIFCVKHFVGIKLALVLGALVFAIIQSLRIEIPEPTGIVLTRDEFPKLFSLIDDICAKLNTRADVVLLDDDYNAYVTQIPKAGFFGDCTNYLMLGLPFMMAQDDKQFIATVAHEFGHLTSNHSKKQQWIVHSFRRWNKLLDNTGKNNILIRPFFAWYMPRLYARAQVVVRKQELEADQFAIDFAGADANADSLVGGDLRAHGYSKASNEIFEQARLSEVPPSDVYHRIQENLNKIPSHELRKWLNEALEIESSYYSTHPSLKDRLIFGNRLEKFESISDEDLLKLCEPMPAGESSAEIYLEKQLPVLMSRMNEDWCNSRKESWSDRYNYYVNQEKFLKELTDKEESQKLNLDELKAKAHYLEELDGDSSAIDVRYKILELSPNDAVSNYKIGVHLIDNIADAKPGRDAPYFLQKSYKSNILYGYAAYYASDYFYEHNMENYSKESIEHIKKEVDDAREERNTLKDSDEFLPHDFDEQEKQAYVDWLSQVKTIKNLYVVRKKLNTLPESKHYIVAMNVKGVSNEELPQMARDVVTYSTFIDYTLSVFIFDAWHKKLESKIKAVPDSLIFERVKKS